MDESGSKGRGWLGVVSAEHVARGFEGGFMQVAHGKQAPLKRLKAGERVAYYSPGQTLGGPADVKSITAFGIVADDDIVQVDMGGGFTPFRRRVRWLSNHRVPIAALQAEPGFALSGPGWGAKLRFGLVSLDADSMDAIERMMVGA